MAPFSTRCRGLALSGSAWLVVLVSGCCHAPPRCNSDCACGCNHQHSVVSPAAPALDPGYAPSGTGTAGPSAESAPVPLTAEQAEALKGLLSHPEADASVAPLPSSK